MDGASAPKKEQDEIFKKDGTKSNAKGRDFSEDARVKLEYEAKIVSLEDATASVFDEDNEVESLADEGSDRTEQYQGIDTTSEYEDTAFPVNFSNSIILKTEAAKNTKTKFIYCQPNETLETVKNSWTHSMTYILIDEYRKMMGEFQDPHKKQKDLWIRLAVNMCHRGYDVTWDMCDQKWRNLKHTFKSIYFNRHRSEESKRRWDFYQALEDVFGPQLETESVNKSNVSTDVQQPEVAFRRTKSRSRVVEYTAESASADSEDVVVLDAGPEGTAETNAEETGAESGENVVDNETVPGWLQELLQQLRVQEERRLAQLRAMHTELLQVERRKCAALEGLLQKLSQ